MKSFLLLVVLSVMMTDCETRSRQMGCLEGWVTDPCKMPKSLGKGMEKRRNEAQPSRTEIRSLQQERGNTGSFSLYHDTNNKTLKVVINGCSKNSASAILTLTVEKDGCPGPFVQYAYRGEKTTITCDFPGKKDKSHVQFFCNDKHSICDDILSTWSPKSRTSPEKYSLKETQEGITISISNVELRDKGLYWCGVSTAGYRAALQQIDLKTEEIHRRFSRSPIIGQNLVYWCDYKKTNWKEIFICKGEDPSMCQPLVSTAHPRSSTGKFSMVDNKEKNITITVRELTAEDTGTYWCGAQSTNKSQSNRILHKLSMTVVLKQTTTLSVFPTQATTSASDDDSGSSQVIGIVCATGLLLLLLLLLFVIVLFFICKRVSSSKNTRSGAAAQHIREDYIYEEIPESTQKSDSGEAVTTVYAVAKPPTNPPPSPHYSTINFQHCPDKAVILSPTTECEYSTVRNRPIYSTVRSTDTTSAL